MKDKLCNMEAKELGQISVVVWTGRKHKLYNFTANVILSADQFSDCYNRPFLVLFWILFSVAKAHVVGSVCVLKWFHLILLSFYSVHELLDFEQKSTGIPPERIILGTCANREVSRAKTFNKSSSKYSHAKDVKRGTRDCLLCALPLTFLLHLFWQEIPWSFGSCTLSFIQGLRPYLRLSWKLLFDYMLSFQVVFPREVVWQSALPSLTQSVWVVSSLSAPGYPWSVPWQRYYT